MADKLGPLGTLMAYIGATLLEVQSAEGAINECITQYIFTVDLNLKTLEEYEYGLRKATLGRFVRELRRRFAFDDKCESTLDDFLNNRNRFIHKFISTDGSGFDLSTQDGMAAAFAFLKDLRAQATIVRETMLGICEAIEVIDKVKGNDAIASEDFTQRAREALNQIEDFKEP